MVDLPGTFSRDAASPDEQGSRDVVWGRQAGERQPDVLVVVLDAANLDNHLRFALELIALGLPVVVALNMVDLAKRDGLELDPAALSRDLGVPVIPTIAVRKRGLDELRNALGAMVLQGHSRVGAAPQDSPDFHEVQARARQFARNAIVRSEEHTSELQSLMRISYAVFCLKQKQ